MRMILALSLLLAASFSNPAESADIRSGLDVGTYPKAFNVTDVTGPAAGNGMLCYRCRYGSQPVVTIFTRAMNDRVASLVKQIDGEVGKHRDHRMAAFVVLLTDSPDQHEETLRNVAKTSGLQHTPLTVYSDSLGPASYRLSEEAEVTVMMWVDEEVRVNHALKFGDLTGDKIASITNDTAKILN